MNPWTIACQAPLSMEFSRQEYWSGLPFPSPGDLPNPGTEPTSPVFQADSSPSKPPGKPYKGIMKKILNLQGGMYLCRKVRKRVSDYYYLGDIFPQESEI